MTFLKKIFKNLPSTVFFQKGNHFFIFFLQKLTSYFFHKTAKRVQKMTNFRLKLGQFTKILSKFCMRLGFCKGVINFSD